MSRGIVVFKDLDSVSIDYLYVDQVDPNFSHQNFIKVRLKLTLGKLDTLF